MYCLFVMFVFTLAWLCVNTINVWLQYFLLLLILQNDNSYFNRVLLTIYGLKVQTVKSNLGVLSPRFELITFCVWGGRGSNGKPERWVYEMI